MHTWFYANAGFYAYVPRRHRLSTRLVTYLAFLKAWSRHIWTSIAHQQLRWNSTLRSYHASYPPRPPPEGAFSHILAHELIVAQEATAKTTGSTFILDADSKPMGVDNRASAFISGDISDFDGHLTESNKIVRGFGGTRISGAQIGTAVLRIEDDTGATHKFRLQNSYYVPGSKDRLFSPQHFAQELRRQKKGPAFETTGADCCVLQWAQFRRTIPLDPMTNVATIRTAPAYKNFMAYCAEAGFDDCDPALDPIAYDAALISDEEDDDDFLPNFEAPQHTLVLVSIHTVVTTGHQSVP